MPSIGQRKAANLYSPLKSSHDLGSSTNGVSLSGMSVPNRVDEKMRFEGAGAE